MKKDNKNRIYFISMLLLGLSMASCLKDDKIDNLEYGIRTKDLEANKIIEFPYVSHTKSLPVLIEGDEAIVEIGEIHLAAKEVAEEDITVNLKLISDRAKVLASVRDLLATSYPTEGKKAVPDKDILSYPASGITIPASVTIPKGKSSIPVSVKIKTSDLKAQSAFIRVDVESVQQEGYLISGNFGKLLLDIKIKSKFEGKYKYECVQLGPWPQYLGYIEQGKEIYLGTVSPVIVETTALSGLFGGNDFIAYTFDDSNKITGVDWYTWIGPCDVEESSYDAATKTTTVKWILRGKAIVEKFTRLD